MIIFLMSSDYLLTDDTTIATAHKSPEFTEKLKRLMETKQQRYTRENKNAAILVASKRKKRKNVRERERVDRHKAIEQELHDIEAEFSLSMEPVSPPRDCINNLNSYTPGASGGGVGIRSNHNSPKDLPITMLPDMGGRGGNGSNNIGRFSPMTSRVNGYYGDGVVTAAPSGRTFIHQQSPGGGRGTVGGRRHMRHNSLGGSHRRQNSLGSSPYRKSNPRVNKNRSNSIGNDPHHGPSRSFGAEDNIAIYRTQSSSPVGPGFEVPMEEYKAKLRPVNLYSSNIFSGSNNTMTGGEDDRFSDLSLPNMTIRDASSGCGQHDAKFPSPQAVIDEVMQTGQERSGHLTRVIGQFTPSKVSSKMSLKHKLRKHRRVNSFDVADSHHQQQTAFLPGRYQFPRRGPGGSRNPMHGSTLPNKIPMGHHRRARSSTFNSTKHRRSSSQNTVGSVGSSRSSTASNTRHKRSSSGHSISSAGSSTGSGGHRRSNSQQSSDVFLHGVVAQTRFI